MVFSSAVMLKVLLLHTYDADACINLNAGAKLSCSFFGDTVSFAEIKTFSMYICIHEQKDFGGKFALQRKRSDLKKSGGKIHF
jgi:hypothetical protein